MSAVGLLGRRGGTATGGDAQRRRPPGMVPPPGVCTPTLLPSLICEVHSGRNLGPVASSLSEFQQPPVIEGQRRPVCPPVHQQAPPAPINRDASCASPSGRHLRAGRLHLGGGGGGVSGCMWREVNASCAAPSYQPNPWLADQRLGDVQKLVFECTSLLTCAGRRRIPPHPPHTH